MARLVIIRDVFEGHKREIVDVPIGAPIADYLPKDFILNPKRTQFIFNGKVIKKPLYEFVSNDEELIVRCFPGITGAMFVAAGATVPFWAIASAFAINMIIGLVVGFALNAIINAIMPPPKPENQPTNGSTEGSATYGWDGIQNTVRNGTPIQLVYGVHKIAGQYLSTFTKAVADGKNKLYMLIGLGAGPFSAINGYTTDQDSITPDTDDLKLEGNTIDSYADVAVSQRLGNWDQSIISGFNDVVVPQSQNKSITSTPDTVTTIGDVEAVELQLRFPGGLYRMDAYGSFLPYDCQIRYRWRLSGGSYGGYTTLTFSAETRSQYNVMERIDFPSSATYQIELERVTADDGGAGDTKYAISIVSLMAVNEISYDDVNYNGVALLSVEAIASEQLNGQLPTVTSIVHGKEVSVYRPADTFGKDTEQNFLANEKLLWGWSTGNYKTIRANNLKLHLKFNESSGTDAADSSGEGNNGTLTNMAGTEWTASKCANMGNALNFDGVNDYVDCGSDDSLRITGDRTLSAWVRLSAGTFPDATTNWIIAYNEDYQDFGFVWDIKGSTARQYFRTSQAGAYTFQYADTALENNTWYHLAVVVSNNIVIFYLDGVADGGGAITVQVPSTLPFLISHPTIPFDGLIDDVCVYNAALTSTDIMDLRASYPPMNHVTKAVSHNTVDMGGYAAETLIVEIDSDNDTSDWDDDSTGPCYVKSVTGDFDFRMKCVVSDGSSDGDGVGLICWSQDDSLDWVAITKMQQSTTEFPDTMYWEARNTVDGASSETSGVSTDTYLRMVRSGTTVTMYSSADNITWTQRASVTASLSDTVYLGPMCYCSASTAALTRFAFSDMEFADSTCYSSECSSNPAWVIHDILTDTHYGMGSYIDSTQIDISSFINFAAYCNELVSDGRGALQVRHRFDGVIDNIKSGWEHVLSICENARAMVLKQGDKIHITWQDEKTAVQLFAMSNIKRGSFVTNYKTPKMNANYWEIQFLNSENDYEQDFLAYIAPDIGSDPYRKQAATKYGVTRAAEASREALFRCLANKHLTQSISFETGIEAVACEPGDVIEVQHAVPAWGIGGRMASAGTSTTANLSEMVTLAVGSTYEIMIRHVDDSIETRTIVSAAGDYWAVTVSPAFDTTPAADEVYAIGVEDILTKAFQVVKIDRSSDLECKIEAIEYNADIFDDDIDDIPDITYTTLPDPRAMPSDLGLTLSVTERPQVQLDGTILNVIDVTYALPSDAVKADVYWRESGRTSWQYAGRSRSSHFIISNNVTYGITYEVAAVAVSAFGVHRDVDTVSYLPITIEGRVSRPSDVTNLSVTQANDQALVRWDAVDDRDLQHYEIRNGPSGWETSVILGTTTDVEYKSLNYATGASYFQVKAVNTSGIYSENAASLQKTLVGRLNENIIIEQNEADYSTEAWPGTKTDMTVDGNDLDLDVGELVGVYTTDVIDCGAAVRSQIRAYVQIIQNDLLATWADSTFTWASDEANVTWAGDEDENFVSSNLQFRYGDTTPAGDYSDFVAGDYSGQYFQFKLTVTSANENFGATVENMTVWVDVPDIFISADDIAIADSATTLTFTHYGTNGFNVVPHFLAVPFEGSLGDTVDVVSVSATQVQIRYYNNTPALAAGKINFIARGY